jgi:GR25 family glycosyltransferase involved in LPS biosynthesis
MRIDGVYINLDRSPERRAEMEQQIAEIALPYPVRRMSAIDGRHQPSCPAGLTAGQYGCWLSHLKALEQSVGDEAHLHIMEDDALLSSALPILPGVVQSLDSGAAGAWDILFLDATLLEALDMCQVFGWAKTARQDGAVRVRAVPKEFTLYGLHSYVVNATRKAFVHEFLARHMAAGRPIDNVTAYGIQSGRLRTFITTPFMTSGSELGLKRTIGEGGDDKFLAWQAFRRLCFYDLDEQRLTEIAAKSARLMDAVSVEDRILGELCAYRMARWPLERFSPGVAEAAGSA